MNTTIDARGLSCPQPVILTRNRMKALGSGEFTVLVDTGTAKENVSRAAGSKGWEIKTITLESAGYRITLFKG